MRQRLSDAEDDAARIRQAIAVLEGYDKPTPNNSQAKREKPKTASRSKAAITLPKIITAVAAKPGQTTTALAKGLDGDQGQILTLLKEAEAEGNVRREGERRGTKWFVVTNENRVASRAAELRSQRKAAA